ncbi:hypothetical protein I6F35_06190 [Bradyrhizobium sp. BRP22]|uniref:hypothetical protein n=1 Tax=Bradyrhizobium sp. BRP22 TaxID=2793821 RepID=UPI001CD51021|nr:hypothetical protein [Bradyrhizobium sp. BRP22]MCA1452809.1 hypothetical protein [Bradyrhizobium sp. BRP22]
MKLKLTADSSATLYLNENDTVTVRSANAPAIAREIARAVTRDDMFEALVAALTPFRSSELGGRLVNMIDLRENGAEETEQRLRRLITFIDVILNNVEERDDAIIATESDVDTLA